MKMSERKTNEWKKNLIHKSISGTYLSDIRCLTYVYLGNRQILLYCFKIKFEFIYIMYKSISNKNNKIVIWNTLTCRTQRHVKFTFEPNTHLHL